MITAPEAMSRPVQATPWKKTSGQTRLLVTLASTLPLVITAATFVLFSLDFTVALIAVFLPIQLIFGVVCGALVKGKRGIADSLMSIAVVFFSTLVAVMLIAVLSAVVINGSKAMSLHFFYQNNVYVVGNTSLEYGGVGHAILGSLLVVGVTTLVTVPLGIAIAVYLTETRSKTRGLIRTLIQAMSGLPSVVAGLFIYAAFIVSGITQGAGWTGSLALFPLMLPTVARIAEESLILVPRDLRWAGLGLGAPNYRVFLQVVLPAAKSGIITAVILGIARIIGETAPLLLTTILDNRTNLNPFVGQIATLPTYVYSFMSNPSTTSTQRAWGATLVILLLVAVLFTCARILSSPKSAMKRKK